MKILKLFGLSDWTRCPALICLFICAAFSLQSAFAMVLIPADPAANWRFSSGNTPNSSSTFVGKGYDFSGVGASPSIGGLLSPITSFSAQHASPGIGGNYTFYNSVTSAQETVIVASHANPIGDVGITTMTRSFSASDNISVLRILDISSGNYTGQPLFMMGTDQANGWVQEVGTAKFNSYIVRFGNPAELLPTGYPSTLSGTSLTFNGYQSGDSGSSILIPYNGQLTIAAAAHYTDGGGSMLLSAPGYDPVTPTNAIMAPTGYALRFTIYDVPSDTANTANVWTGGNSTGAFADAANWNQSLVPNNLPVVFDSTANNGQNTLSLGANQALRGILFRSNTNTSLGGFTITTGNTLSVGYSGIRNEDSNTQIFNSDIALTAAQNWEAVNGNLAFNGNIRNNGNLLVVQGARNTAFSGVVSGRGGLAKDDAGTLTLNTANTYTGTTFLHNGTIALGTSNALPTGTIVRFDVANPAVLDLNGQTQTVGDVRSVNNGTGTVAVNGGSLNVGTDNQRATYAGIFTGSGSVTKSGLGTWVLSGNSSGYNGSINASGGVLQVATAIGSVNVNAGGALTGTGTVAGGVTLNAGSLLTPGVAGLGSLTDSGGLIWNGGGTLLFSLNAPGTSTALNLGSSSLTKGSFGNYAFSFLNGGGLATGLYTLMNFGSTTFNVGDFGYTNRNGFSGNFLLNSGNLQFQVNSIGTAAPTGGWNNFTDTVTAYDNTANWINGSIKSQFTENVQSGFVQAVQFQNSNTLSGPLTVNLNSLDPIPGGGYGVNTKGWYLVSKTTSLATLTLGGDIQVNNAYTQINPQLPLIIPNASVGTTVALGGANGSVGNGTVGNAGYNLGGVDLGGANRMISTNLPGDGGGSVIGFFIEAPLTDISNSGASVTKTGLGNLILGATNTFTGDLNIQNGSVSLIGYGTLAAKNITVSGGSEFYISNTSYDLQNGTVSNANRLTASGGPNLTLKGADIEFAATAGQTLAFNTVNALQGIEIVHPKSNSGNNATITMAALNRSQGAMLLLPDLATTGGAGTSGAYVQTSLINGVAPVTGTVIPWAYTGGGNGRDGLAYTGFAVYNATYGFQPASASGADTNYLSGTGFSGVTTASDYQLTASYALTSGTQVNSLVSGASSNLTITSASGPFTLKIGSGGLIFSAGGTIGSTTAASNVPLDFNNQEAIIAVNSGQGNLLGPIVNANGLTVSGASMYGYASLYLNFTNPYNSDSAQTAYNWGSTYINAGRLAIQNANALPNTGAVTVNIAAANTNTNYSYVTAAPAVLDLYGNSVTIGALNGGGIVSLASMFTGPTGKLNGTLTLGNGGDSGSFSGQVMNTLFPLLPFGGNQGNQMTSYGAMGNAVTLGITKTGTGTETFSGINTYTGATLVNGGTIALSGSGTLGINSSVNLRASGATLDISASTITPAIGSLTGIATASVKLGASTLSFGSNSIPTTFSGSISGAGGGILKTGAGMTTLSGANSYTGSTTVNFGILQINHSTTTAAMLSTLSPIVVGGGALQLIGNTSAVINEVSAGLTVNPGGSAITLYNPSVNSTALSLGGITRNAGGTVDFTSVGGASSINTTTPGGSILGGWATANGGSDWATVSAGVVVPASTVAGALTVANDVSTWGVGTANVVGGAPGFSGTTSAGTTVNSIFFQGTGSSNINIADTLTVNSGGILETSAVGNNPSVITGGILQTGNGQDLIIIQNNPANSLTIGSTIFGMNGLTKSGPGTLVISGNDIHYGATNVNAGKISVVGSATLGANSSLRVATNGLVDFSQSSAAQSFSSVVVDGGLILGAGGLTLGSDDSSSTVGGVIGGKGGMTKNGAGTLTLSGFNGYGGPLTINGGTVAVSGYGTLGVNSAVTINSANSVPSVLDLSNAGSAVSIGSLSGAGNLILNPAGMTIGSDNTSTVFSGFIAGIGGFTKVGTGTLTLSGSNLSGPVTEYRYTPVEGETVNGGTLLLDYRDSAGNKIQTGGAVSLGGGSVVAIGNATATFTQNTGYYCYVNPGASSVTAITPVSGTASFTLSLTNFNRTLGGTVDITAVSGGGGGIASVTTNSGVTNGILGGYLTVNGMSDWALVTSSKVVGPVTPSIAEAVSATALNTYTATTSSGSIWLYNVSGTAGLAIGQGVVGAGIPAGTTIVGFSGSTFVRLSNAATATSSGTISIAFDGLTVSNAAQLSVGQGIAGSNIPAGATIASIVGSTISLSSVPTGTVSGFATSGYSLGTTNDQGATIATLDNPSNWTAANYGSNLSKANLADNAGFSGTVPASATINSLRVNATAPANIGISSGQTVTVASGGILETAAVGGNAVNITGGALATGNNADLIFIQNNVAAPMTVSSAITSYGVTKSGSGVLILAGNNAYNGATTVNSGTLALGGSSTVGNGSSAVTVMPGATLDLQGSTSPMQTFGSLASMSNGGGTGGGTVILGSSIGTLTVGGNNTSTIFSGVIQDGAGSTAGLTKVGAGVLTLGGSNSYTGPTLINAGTLLLGIAGVIAGDVSVGNGSAVAMLAGSGTVGNVSVDSTSGANYGILEPGIPAAGPFTIQTAGLLTTNSLSLSGPNAKVNFLLGSSAMPGSTYSTVVVNGNLTLAGAVLNITTLDAFGPGTYHLFTYTGTETGTLTLGTLPVGFVASQISISYGGGKVDLVASPKLVPEPGTWAMLLAGAALVLVARVRFGKRCKMQGQNPLF